MTTVNGKNTVILYIHSKLTFKALMFTNGFRLTERENL